MIFSVTSGTTPKYTASLVDENDNPVGSSDLTTLTLTVINERTGAVINSRDRQDVKNANGCTISAGGAFVWSLVALDLPATQEEWYRCVLEWSWNLGAKKGAHSFELRVFPVPRPTA